MTSAFREHLAREYGGTKPYACHLWHLLAYRLGAYRPHAATDAAFSRFVFVCKGNICRSPYAAMKARQLGLNAISAGLDTTPGKPANPVAATVSQRRGIDLSAHRTQRLRQIDCTERDLLLVMEPAQIAAAEAAAPNGDVRLLGTFMQPSRPFLQDPFGRSEAYFERCYDLIDNALVALCRRFAQPDT